MDVLLKGKREEILCKVSLLVVFQQIFWPGLNGIWPAKESVQDSMQTPVENPLMTIESFNKQFQIGEKEREAVKWGAIFSLTISSSEPFLLRDSRP